MIHQDPDNVSETPFDLTPMIDVVMLLIVFFMLTAQFAQSNQVPMDLPLLKGEPGTDPKTAAVFVDLEADGSLRLHDESITLDRLAQLVAADIKKQPDTELIVRADRRCQARHLNELAVTLAAAGARRWRLATQSPEGGG